MATRSIPSLGPEVGTLRTSPILPMSYVSRAGPEPRPERLTHVLDRNALEVRIVRETPITSESDPERRSTVKPLRRRVPGGETDGCDGPGPDGRRTSPRTASGLPWKRKRVSYSGSPSGLAWTQRTDSPRDSPSMCANRSLRGTLPFRRTGVCYSDSLSRPLVGSPGSPPFATRIDGLPNVPAPDPDARRDRTIDSRPGTILYRRR